MDSPQLDRAIRIKTSTLRGGTIENIYVRNVTVGQCKEAVLKINLLYESNEPGDRIHTPIVRNVFMENVTSTQSRYGVLINGLPDEACVYNINLTDCSFDGVKTNGNNITGMTKNINFNNLKINGKISTL